MKTVRCLVAGMIMLAAGMAQAAISPYAAVDFTQITNASATNWNLGWWFTPKDDITAGLLGFFDAGRDGLAESHAVGLFDATGTLLRTATVTDSDPWGVLGDGYLFKWHTMDQGPISLVAGENYAVMAVTGNSDAYTWNPSDFVENWATFLGSAYSESGILEAPTLSDGNVGYFGPNIGVVPEPSTIILLGLGAGALVVLRRRPNQ